MGEVLVAPVRAGSSVPAVVGRSLHDIYDQHFRHSHCCRDGVEHSHGLNRTDFPWTRGLCCPGGIHIGNSRHQTRHAFLGYHSERRYCCRIIRRSAGLSLFATEGTVPGNGHHVVRGGGRICSDALGVADHGSAGYFSPCSHDLRVYPGRSVQAFLYYRFLCGC